MESKTPPPESEPESRPDKLSQNVPFTAQAPFGNWHDRRYQNACEEASVLMAAKWLNGENLTAEEASAEIAEMVAYQQENYGFYIDSSAKDTARFFREYYGYQNIRLKDVASVEDIKLELAAGNLVIVPADGQKLGNPNYTPPGPARHMLIVIGYDDERGVFITNDPGTRRGQGFVYAYDILFAAIRDYESGDHTPIINGEKSMIVVEAL